VAPPSSYLIAENLLKLAEITELDAVLQKCLLHLLTIILIFMCNQ